MTRTLLRPQRKGYLSRWFPTTTSFSSTMLGWWSFSRRVISRRLLMGMPARSSHTYSHTLLSKTHPPPPGHPLGGLLFCSPSFSLSIRTFFRATISSVWVSRARSEKAAPVILASLGEPPTPTPSRRKENPVLDSGISSQALALQALARCPTGAGVGLGSGLLPAPSTKAQPPPIHGLSCGSWLMHSGVPSVPREQYPHTMP